MNSINGLFLLYADPGAGALLLQMLMAVLFGGLFFFRSIRDRVLGFFGKGPYADSNEMSSDKPLPQDPSKTIDEK